MKISKVVTRLQEIEAEYGDIDVQLQIAPRDCTDKIVGYEEFFIVVDQHIDVKVCNLRIWLIEYPSW